MSRFPNFSRPLCIRLVGTAPIVLNRFDPKSEQAVMAEDYRIVLRRCCWIGKSGCYGVPAAAFKAAITDAIRMFVKPKLGHAKTRAAVIVEPDDTTADGLPLIALTVHGEPQPFVSRAGNFIRMRPCWKHWDATLRVRRDSAVLSADEIHRAIYAAGCVIGIGFQSGSVNDFGMWSIS